MKVLSATATEAPEGWVVGKTDLEDAAVLRWVDGSVMVQTVDFITPVVDDPYVFGQVAAANALSDVYAMGAQPRFALNIVGFPSDRVPLEVLERILAGGASKVVEAGAHIAGGHSVSDPEPKYGLAVTGFANEEELVRQSGAEAGDVLVLTKPLGTGLLVGAIRRDEIEPTELDALVASMTRLNADASICMREAGAHAATDVTGFGLLGHAKHIAVASGVSIALWAHTLPLLPGARERAEKASLGGAAGRNWRYVEDAVTLDAPDWVRRVAVDPQTSGGLLIAVPPDRAETLLDSLHRRGVPAARVGHVRHDGAPGTLFLSDGSTP